MKKSSICYLLLLIAGLNCTFCQAQEPKLPQVKWSPKEKEALAKRPFDAETYYDKVLGALVGSAIGDGMGAPTEMWHRDYIKPQWGYVEGFDPVIREDSPEGTWEDNMPAGSTTDDTRWKHISATFLKGKKWGLDSLNARDFAHLIVKLYQIELDKALKVKDEAPEILERALTRKTFLQEWVKVSKPYIANDLDAYAYALHRFYGGEMSCAGMLYAPAIGAFYPGNPERAYTESYRLGLFDLGYARDISGLTGALVAQAMAPGIAFDQITQVCRQVDPLQYANSRLVGRVSYRALNDAKNIAFEALQITKADSLIAAKYQDSRRSPLFLTQLDKAYQLMDAKLQDTPFHAAEIHFINLCALEFSKGDFNVAMEFVVNYGRDNDTVAAVTGAILGGWLGFKKLPDDLKKQALEINRKVVGIDLEELARWMSGN
jgi:hypothetical protein